MKLKGKYVRILKGAPELVRQLARQKKDRLLYVSDEDDVHVILNSGDDHPVYCPKEFVEEAKKVEGRRYKNPKKKSEKRKWTDPENYTLLCRFFNGEYNRFVPAEITQFRQKLCQNYLDKKDKLKLDFRTHRSGFPMTPYDYYIIMQAYSEPGVQNGANNAKHIARLTFRKRTEIPKIITKIEHAIGSGLGFADATPKQICDHCAQFCTAIIQSLK